MTGSRSVVLSVALLWAGSQYAVEDPERRDARLGEPHLSRPAPADVA